MVSHTPPLASSLFCRFCGKLFFGMDGALSWTEKIIEAVAIDSKRALQSVLLSLEVDAADLAHMPSVVCFLL